MFWPLIQKLLGDVRNTIKSATSPGEAGLPTLAILLATFSPKALVKSFKISVLTAAGHTELIRNSLAFNSSVLAIVMAIIASFERLYALAGSISYLLKF